MEFWKQLASGRAQKLLVVRVRTPGWLEFIISIYGGSSWGSLKSGPWSVGPGSFLG